MLIPKNGIYDELLDMYIKSLIRMGLYKEALILLKYESLKKYPYLPNILPKQLITHLTALLVFMIFVLIKSLLLNLDNRSCRSSYMRIVMLIFFFGSIELTRLTNEFSTPPNLKSGIKNNMFFTEHLLCYREQFL